MPKKMQKKASKKAKIVKIMKKAIVKKAIKAPKVTKSFVVDRPLNRTQIIKYLAEVSCIQKKDVMTIMNALVDLVSAHLKKRGPGEFTLLGLAKFRVIHKPATKARQGVNPFTGEPTMFAAKPARNVVKIKPLKRIKEMAE